MDATYGDDCSNSALNVYDGEDHNATLLGVYCGRKTHLPVVSRGNVLFLELSQISYNDIQFWATYSTESSDCGGVLIGDVGSFASPGYPGTYPPNSDCVWLLTQAPGNERASSSTANAKLKITILKSYRYLRESGTNQF